MIVNYLLVAWRVFKKNRFYNIINITGLGLAITACFIITLYVTHENNYDSFQKNANNIFSIYSRIKLGADTIEFPLMNYTTAPTIARVEPLVKDYTRIHHPYKEVIVQNPDLINAKFKEDNFLFADSNFFSFFSFPLKFGNPHFVLQKPFSLVITEGAAKKYFGNVDPIGKLLKYDSAYTFQITGVAKDPPSNSIFKFEFVAALSSKLSMDGSNLILSQQGISYGDFQTFFLLKNHDASSQFESNIRKLSLKNPQDQNIKSIQYVIPLLKMHLHTKFGDTSNTKYLSFFPIVALLILLLALVNYVSLLLATSILRAKEIGLRKIVGASKEKIITQFFIESSAYITIAFFIGMILLVTTKSFLFKFLQVKIDDYYIYNMRILFIFFSIFLLAILFSGSYPALVFSAYKPTGVLFKKSKNKNGIILRKLLSVFQFSIAIAVIVCSIIISSQLYFIQHINTGIDRSNILMVPFTNTMHTNFYSFKQDIKRLPAVSNVATARYPLYQKFQVLTATENGTDKTVSLPSFTTDDQFISLLNLSWQIPPNDPSAYSKNDIIINEVAINKLKLGNNPVGEDITVNGEEYFVKGVLKNFNYSSLTSSIDALCLFVKPDSVNGWGTKKDGCMFIKFHANTNIPALINSIQHIYSAYDQNTPFSFSFLNDSYKMMYKPEDRLASIIHIFTIITISTALLGLLGLASFSAQQRVKEIGIRKVLGASTYLIVYLLIKEFIKPVLVASIIGTLLARYFVYKWLESFAYHISISIWVFIFSIALTLALSIITIGSLSIKAALLNPIKNLRSD